MTQKRIELRIRGRVQGVGYRYSACEQARRLGLRGWVRNTDSGDVELLAEGGEDQLHRLLEWSRSGPPGARVVAIDERWLEAAGDLDRFEIRR
ncbi:MAG: acylphosphatase [Deltaproteobacteria bacterium]|nr:acylphosphatase [Deltaproteobacteria bacterium]